MKKIIELPDYTDAKTILFIDGSRTHRMMFGNLPNAPVKPVIEVDGELLKKFEALRNDPWITNVWDFLTNANLDGRAMNNAARWYLGYIDLVPKEDK